MRIVKLAIAGGLLVVLLAGTTMADQAWTSGLRQPASVQTTAFEYDDYHYFAAGEEASDSPSDEPAEEQPAVEGGDGCCEPSCGKRCGAAGDPWTIPQPCVLANHGITAGGWISAGLFANAWGDASNGPLGFNNVGDGFTMNQLWFFLNREADTGGSGTDWGFRMDYVFGVDGPDTQAFGDGGWDFGWNTGRDYGSAIPQLYVEFAINDVSIKLGHFYTMIGWEVVPAPDNFFYSHAYTMYYGEPFTHTGALVDWAYNDRVTFYAGWTAGWDSGWENLNDASTFLGGVGLQLTDNASLIWALSAGDNGGPAGGDIYMNSICFEWNVTDRFTYILQHDLGDNTGLGAANNEWYGINQYLLYQLNDRWAAGTRIEWFRDDDAARVGWAGNFYEVAVGMNYKPTTNLMVRPEIRWDWFEGAAAPGARPFNEGRDTAQFSGGFDVIWTF